ncbi:MAG: hypothetical protein QG591_2351 [Planctomycetota bacterium]|nr:hypothetical protein [Planctomycetota bacterium]
MKTYKTSAVVFLLVICIIAIVLGYAGSKNIPEEKTTSVIVEANSTGIVIPQYLITNEVKNILSEVNRTYPDSILFGDEQVTLIGSKTVDSFNDSINENSIDFDWNAVYPFYELDTSVVTDGPYIVYSSTPHNSVTISYDELEKILNGDNETVSYFRELLNNSKRENNGEHIFNVEGNTSAISVVLVDKDNSSLQNSGAVMTISSSGNYSE